MRRLALVRLALPPARPTWPEPRSQVFALASHSRNRPRCARDSAGSSCTTHTQTRTRALSNWLDKFAADALRLLRVHALGARACPAISARASRPRAFATQCGPHTMPRSRACQAPAAALDPSGRPRVMLAVGLDGTKITALHLSRASSNSRDPHKLV